jgi:3-oxoacyl-[acyl-carrier-protein] synthase II
VLGGLVGIDPPSATDSAVDVTERQPVAVTGLGAITALGVDADTSFRSLLAGDCGIKPIRLFDTSGCRVEVAAEAPDPHAPPGFAAACGPALTRTAVLALHAAASALEQSKWTGGRLDRMGLVLGSAGCGTPALEDYLELLQTEGCSRSRAQLMFGFPKRIATDVVAFALSLGGPRTTVNTACSSGAVAVIHALELLAAGQCDAVLAGGADELTRFTLSGFCSLRAVDPAPCRPFDRRRRGMSIGEGAGFLLLERLEDARRRGAHLHAIVAGAGQSCDADHLTAPDPEGRSAARAMQEALRAAGVTPRQLAFVSAHGTGTLHNDAAEVKAIRRVLGEHARAVPVHTVKSSIGHCMGAAGAVEAVFAILSLQHRQVPPTVGLADPEFAGELDFVTRSSRSITGSYALSNSFGFGGNNAALLLARPEVAG